MIQNAILIAGPTASGKSAFALQMARRTGGAIVNCDSMQVYSQLRIITARPDDAEMDSVPHHLYGHRSASQPYSVGQWIDDVKELIAGGSLDGKTVIFTGGTGLYFRALLGGLSSMPDIPPAIRNRWRQKLVCSGAAGLHADLARMDPRAAKRIGRNDPQRIVRALEVFESSGRSILDWRDDRNPAVIDADQADCRLILPDRAVLNRRINDRLDVMMKEGGVEEVRALKALGLDPSMPAMKAIGVPQLIRAVEGQVSLERGIDDAKTATRQFAKRQTTWFRNQLDANWIRYGKA